MYIEKIISKYKVFLKYCSPIPIIADIEGISKIILILFAALEKKVM